MSCIVTFIDQKFLAREIQAIWLMALILLIAAMPAMAWAQATFEAPQEGSVQSGVGLIQGWRCEEALIEVEIDGGAPLGAAYGTSRLDTSGVCNDDGNNGWGLTFNWNLLSAGQHEIRALANGEEFGQATFTVVKPSDAEFLTGVSGEVVATDFPEPGTNVRLVWQESAQNFVIAESDIKVFQSGSNPISGRMSGVAEAFDGGYRERDIFGAAQGTFSFDTLWSTGPTTFSDPTDIPACQNPPRDIGLQDSVMVYSAQDGSQLRGVEFKVLPDV